MNHKEASIILKYPNDMKSDHFLEALDMAVDALEKQSPKRVLPDTEYHLRWVCPSCRAHFLDRSANFCANCGQALLLEDKKNDKSWKND